MSAFWKHYASVTDDVRHKLIEEGWFGRQVTGDTTAQDMPGIADQAPEPETSHTPHDQTWGKAATHAEVYGQAPTGWGQAAPSTTPEPEPPTPQQETGPAPEL